MESAKSAPEGVQLTSLDLRHGFLLREESRWLNSTSVDALWG